MLCRDVALKLFFLPTCKNRKRLENILQKYSTFADLFGRKPGRGYSCTYSAS